MVMDEIQSATNSADEAVLADSDLLTQFTPEEQVIAQRLIPVITRVAHQSAEARKAEQLQAEVAKLIEENKLAMQKQLDELKKAMTPPTTDELSALLNQEYVSFTAKLPGEGGGTRDFVICELPITVEKQIILAVHKALGPRIKEFTSIDWTGGTTMLEKVNTLIQNVPGLLDTLAGVCALCLDPKGGVSAEWVMENMGSQKMLAILHCQIAASRYRDFLSLAARLFPQTVME